MEQRHVTSALARQIAAAGVLGGFYCLSTAHDGVPVGTFPWMLLVCGPVMYLLNDRFLRRERTARQVLILNVGATAAVCVLCLVLDGWQGWAQAAVAAACVLMVTALGQRSAEQPPGMSSLLLWLDGSILMLVLFVAYGAWAGAEPVRGLPTAAAVAASILGVMTRRSSRAPGWKEWLLLVCGFSVILGGMWLLVGVAAVPAAKSVVLIWELLGRLMDWLWSLLVAFGNWWTSLFPEQYGKVELEQEIPVWTPEDLPEETVESPLGRIIGALVLLVLTVMALVALWKLMQALGRRRVGGKKTAAPPERTRLRFGFRKALKTAAGRWSAALRLRLWLRRHRNTPEGLYFLLVHRCRMSPWHKQTGETPREFLRRLQGYAQGDEALCRALEEMIPEVDRALYGGAVREERPAQAALIRGRIGAAVRRQMVRGGLEGLRRRLNLFAET